MKKLIFIAIATLTLTSCTDNARARHWGGTEEISLNKNEVVDYSILKKDKCT